MAALPPKLPSTGMSQVMQLGDSIIVCGVEFVLTEVHMQFNKPSVLTTKTPEELRTINPSQEL